MRSRKRFTAFAFVLLVIALGAPWEADALRVPQQDCGNEGEVACAIGASTLNGRCDTGLKVGPLEVCGCLVDGLFGKCAIAKLCEHCVNHTRRHPSIDGYAGSWFDWALRNQRVLAVDEPLNWVMRLGTHNSFNTVADGHTVENFPNQFYSITDQLRAGSRVLTLDTYFFTGAARLCHGGSPEAAPLLCAQLGDQNIYPIYPPGARYYANSIKEISNWLDDNPKEVVIIDLEDYVVEQGGSTKHIGDPLDVYLGGKIRKGFVHPAGSDIRRWPTWREMLKAGQQVIVFDKVRADHGGTVTPGAFNETDAVGPFGDEWLAKNLRRYPDCPVDNMRDKDTTFTITVEERELGTAMFGTLNEAAVEAAVECNYNLIVLDKFAVELPGIVDLPNFARHRSAVWGWELFDRGQYGDCALVRLTFPGSFRWNSEDCTHPAPFTCARPRSESGLDPVDWTDPAGEDWQVTSRTGAWSEGFAACAAEFPGYVFGAPVNGYQNRKLVDQLSRKLADEPLSGFHAWLNYRQQNSDDNWAIQRIPGVNAPPVADAGHDQSLECSGPPPVPVTLDGSRSRDADGDTLNYTWSGPFGTLAGPVVKTALPLGTHAIQLKVTDGKGGADTDTTAVTVTDTRPPFIKGIRFTPSAIGPANNQLVRVTAAIDVIESCDAEPAISLVSITYPGASADELASDVQQAKLGTDDRDFQLRARKPVKGNGLRTYTVTYRATDRSGNLSEASAQIPVGVP